MKRKIWLINPYAMPPDREMRIQTLKRAQYLAEYGYDVTIIGGSYLHNTDINLITDNRQYYEANYGGIKFIHIRTIRYKNNGLRRMGNMVEFPLRLLLLGKHFQKPDIISQVATIPFGNILYFLARRFKAKYIVDVVDLWPESFVAFNLISRKNPVLWLAYTAEHWLYKRADRIVFSMEGGKDYIIEKRWNIEAGGDIDLAKVFYINNGVDLAEFDYNRITYKLPDTDLEDDSIFKVVYLGSIRLANDVKLLIEAAEILKNKKEIVFLIYGDGDDRKPLEYYCRRHNVTNVKFKQKWVELKYVPYILSKCSLNIMNYMQSPIGRFGVSQSKSFQYMASGKPICANRVMGYSPISRYNLGVEKEFNNCAEYADAILSFANMDEDEYSSLCENVRQAAKHYDYQYLTAKYAQLLE